jgi:hypothetical protein
MKFPVLYVLIFAGFCISEADGQKPVIDLLPADHSQIGSQVVNDTSFICDSLFHMTVPALSEMDREPEKEKVQAERSASTQVRFLPGWFTGMIILIRCFTIK